MFTLKTTWYMVPISMKCIFMCLEVVFGKTEYIGSGTSKALEI